MRNKHYFDDPVVKDDGTVVNLADIGGGGGGGGSSYSTDETVVGKWIDGATDVYEKTFVGTSSGAQNFTVLVAGFFNDAELISAVGWYGDYAIPFYSADAYKCLVSKYNVVDLAISYGASIRGKKYVITARYIKK